MVAPLLTVAAQAADLPNFRRITKLIAIGGPPTDDGINVLYNEHFSTVIDLRDVSDRTSQEGARVERMGKISVQVPFKYVNIPLGGSPPTNNQLSKYLVTLDTTPADKTDWIPMFYIHAGSKDLNLPTTMVAIWRIYHDAWDYDKAFSEMTSTGFNIKSPGASELIDFVKSYAEAHKP
jgi:hypothetical protein